VHRRRARYSKISGVIEEAVNDYLSACGRVDKKTGRAMTIPKVLLDRLAPYVK